MKIPSRRVTLMIFACLFSGVILARWANHWTSLPPRPARQRGDTQLAPCPDSPNCVSTQCSDSEHAIAPIAVAREGWPADREVMAEVARVASSMGGRIVQQETDYLHVEFRSRILGFVDDVEFLWDEDAGQLHFRSASRVGYSDLGANRSRMERFRELFAR